METCSKMKIIEIMEYYCFESAKYDRVMLGENEMTVKAEH